VVATDNVSAQITLVNEAFKKLTTLMQPYAREFKLHERRKAKAHARSVRNQHHKRKHGRSV
jgi:hypothetical protein